MKIFPRIFPQILLSALLIAPGAFAEAVSYSVVEGSSVRFKAAANVHGFNGSTDSVTGNVSYDPAAPLSATGEIVISSDDLRTGDRKRDINMRRSALETDKYPKIIMKMHRFVPAKVQPEPGKVEGNIHGELTLHGAVRKILVPAVVEDRGDSKLHVSGAVGIDMTNWEIAPPVTRVLFMALRVLPNVSVAFDLDLEPQSPENLPVSGDLQDRLDRIEALKAKLQR